MNGPSPRRPLLERVLDGPEQVALWIPWPSTIRILIKGTLGFVRQLARSRTLGLRIGTTTPLTDPTDPRIS